jgi:dihydrofolate reductase
MDICLIWAPATHRLAERAGPASWLGVEDLRRFQSVTERHPVVMGYRTWEAIPRALLEGRQSFVLSRRKTSVPGAVACESLHEAFTLASVLRSGRLFLLGGTTLFEEGLRIADRVFVARPAADNDADAPLPPLDSHHFEPVIQDRSSVIAATRLVQEYRRRRMH